MKSMVFADGKADAFLGFPQPAGPRTRQIGHLIVDSAGSPLVPHFCCMLYGNSEYVRNHPIATKRAARSP
jgi:NitT/TauT family transport system substrate-binding protein